MIKLNEHEIEWKNYPNGESYIHTDDLCLPPGEDWAVIDLHYENDSDLLHLIFLTRYLQDDVGDLKIELNIRYMPYSRMDRHHEGFIFGLKYICDVINDLEIEHVRLYEPHSDVSPALLDRCTVISLIDEMFPAVERFLALDPLYDFIVFPDVSAAKRYSKFFPNWVTFTGIKDRDFGTGNINSLRMVRDKSTTHETSGSHRAFRAVLVDDLCSGGRTFELAAKQMSKSYGVNRSYLLVPHCEGTVLNGPLPESNHVRAVFTTDSMWPSIREDRSNIHHYLGVWNEKMGLFE